MRGQRSGRRPRKKPDALVLKRKRGFLDKQKEHLLAEDANRNFYKHVRNFSKLECPKLFDVRDLVPGKTDEEVAETLAVLFNRISQEFDELREGEIPETYSTGLPTLRTHEVAARIRRFRKPKSMVPGDIFPKLVTKFSDFLAIPLTMIYNEISRTAIWPSRWKKNLSGPFLRRITLTLLPTCEIFPVPCSPVRCTSLMSWTG